MLGEQLDMRHDLDAIDAFCEAAAAALNEAAIAESVGSELRADYLRGRAKEHFRSALAFSG